MLFGRSRSLRTLLHSTFVATSTLVAAQVLAAPTQPPTAIARTRATGGQPEMRVGFDAQGKLRAAIGAGNSDDVSRGLALTVPDSLLTKRAQAQFEIVPIGEQRYAVVVTIPTDDIHRPWQALIVAKPGKTEPEVLFQGFTGFVEGEDGLRHGPLLEVSAPVDDSGSRRIVLGQIREELTLCGRRATLSPKMLSPKDLALKPAKVQRLSAEERERAPKLFAEPHAISAPDQQVSATGNAKTQGAVTATSETHLPTVPPAPEQQSPKGGQASLLRPIGATSAIGWPASLTDGDPETTWAENRGGAGRGEFVSFRAPSDVPLQGFRFIVKPEKRMIPNGAGPEQLWLVTKNEVFSVSFPSDPWKSSQVSWQVKLPNPVQTDCVAIVTESAYGEKPDSEVTLAEVVAESEFANANLPQLVGALAGGGPRAEAAGSVLSSMGPDAHRAVAEAFDGLDEDGRRVALDVLDHAPCEISGPVYVTAVLGKTEGHRLHALDRLRRCNDKIVLAIEAAIAKYSGEKQTVLLSLLAEIAPERAITYLAPRLVGGPQTRKVRRALFAQASRSPKAQESIRAQLSNPSLPRQAQVELLRALGPRLVEYSAEAAPLLERLLASDTNWKLRYLMLEPAHVLAKSSPSLARTLKSYISTDTSAYIRKHAVESVSELELFASELVASTRDADVRVRQAATQVLAKRHQTDASQALLARLKDDSWPIVRASAAESLASQPAGHSTDKSLISALDDDSWLVRVAVAEALGERHSPTASEALLEHFKDRDERFEVRVATANALGKVCAESALDELTTQARKLKSPGMDIRDRSISASALSALAEIHPTDLAKRLDPLLNGKDTPKEVKKAATAALSTQSRCRLPNAPVTASIALR